MGGSLVDAARKEKRVGTNDEDSPWHPRSDSLFIIKIRKSGFLDFARNDTESPDRRNQPVPPPARPQPCGVVAVARRCTHTGARTEYSDSPEHRVCGVSLVSRDGARVV